MSFFNFIQSRAPSTAINKASPDRLQKYVTRISQTAVPRTFDRPEGLEEAAAYIEAEWQSVGLRVERQWFKAGGSDYANVMTYLGPASASRIVIGAHYDVAGEFNPGADDNASGLAGLLELARILKPIAHTLKHRIDLVAFCLEEPPFFGGPEMGSAVHARSLKAADVLVDLMLSLEMIGYFSDEKGSQEFPLPALKAIYPTRGTFIGVVGDMTSVRITKRVRDLIARNSSIDAQFINAPRDIAGIDLSDHRNYWNEDYPAVMITDTAFFRNPHYHGPDDKPETLNYEKMAEVVNGVTHVALQF